MTPKEKAEDLVDKFLNQPINFPYIDTEDGQCIGSGYMTYYSAKQCALIAVDEVLNRLKSCWDEEGVLIQYKYFQGVKNEIENL